MLSKCILCALFVLPFGIVFGDVVNIELTSSDLGLGSAEINYDANDSAVKADIAGKLITSTENNIGSVLYIQTDGKAGMGNGDDIGHLLTVTARSYLSIQDNLPLDHDIHAGVITLSKDEHDISKEGLGVRAFGINKHTEARYVNPDYTCTNGHGFQMEGSKEVSGGFGFTDWNDFYDDLGDVPRNNPPHVNEDVTFTVNTDMFAVKADGLKALLTKVKAASAGEVGVDLTVNLVGGGYIYRSYGDISEDDDTGVFTVLKDGRDGVVEINFGNMAGIETGDIVESFTIGARDDTADGPNETDEHFLINGITADYTTPEPMSLCLLGLGGLMIRRCK